MKCGSLIVLLPLLLVGAIHFRIAFNKKVLLRKRKRHTAHPVASPGGYLPWLGGTHLCGGYLPWPGGYLPCPGGTYLCWGSTYFGQGVPNLTGAYLPWLGMYLPWPGRWGSYLGQGGTYLGPGVPPWLWTDRCL